MKNIFRYIVNQLTSKQPGWNQYLRYEDNFISGKSTEVSENSDSTIHGVAGACPSKEDFETLRETLKETEEISGDKTDFDLHDLQEMFCTHNSTEFENSET